MKKANFELPSILEFIDLAFEHHLSVFGCSFGIRYASEFYGLCSAASHIMCSTVRSVHVSELID